MGNKMGGRREDMGGGGGGWETTYEWFVAMQPCSPPSHQKLWVAQPTNNPPMCVTQEVSSLVPLHKLKGLLKQEQKQKCKLLELFLLNK